MVKINDLKDDAFIYNDVTEDFITVGCFKCSYEDELMRVGNDCWYSTVEKRLCFSVDELIKYFKCPAVEKLTLCGGDTLEDVLYSYFEELEIIETNEEGLAERLLNTLEDEDVSMLQKLITDDCLDRDKIQKVLDKISNNKEFIVYELGEHLEV